jgi:hypothetical protein
MLIQSIYNSSRDLLQFLLHSNKSLFILWNYQKLSFSYSSVIIKIHGKSSSIVTLVYINIQLHSIFFIDILLSWKIALSLMHCIQKKWILQYFFCHGNISIETQTRLNKKEKSFRFFSFLSKNKISESYLLLTAVSLIFV